MHFLDDTMCIPDPPQHTFIEQDVATIGGELSCTTDANPTVLDDDYRWNISGVAYTGQVIELPVHEGEMKIDVRCCASNEIRGNTHNDFDFNTLDVTPSKSRYFAFSQLHFMCLVLVEHFSCCILMPINQF